jgi:hypothetical protein
MAYKFAIKGETKPVPLLGAYYQNGYQTPSLITM